MDYKAIAEWALGRTGASSKCIARHMMGMENDGSYPHDGDDFGRCEDLLDSVPSLRERLTEMSVVNCYWEALVPRWEEIRESKNKNEIIRSIIRPIQNTDRSHIRLSDGVSLIIGKPS